MSQSIRSVPKNFYKILADVVYTTSLKHVLSKVNKIKQFEKLVKLSINFIFLFHN